MPLWYKTSSTNRLNQHHLINPYSYDNSITNQSCSAVDQLCCCSHTDRHSRRNQKKRNYSIESQGRIRNCSSRNSIFLSLIFVVLVLGPVERLALSFCFVAQQGTFTGFLTQQRKRLQPEILQQIKQQHQKQQKLQRNRSDMEILQPTTTSMTAAEAPAEAMSEETSVTTEKGTQASIAQQTYESQSKQNEVQSTCYKSFVALNIENDSLTTEATTTNDISVTSTLCSSSTSGASSKPLQSTETINGSTSSTNPRVAMIIQRWHEQYVKLMNDVMTQDRVLYGYLNNKKIKKKLKKNKIGNNTAPTASLLPESTIKVVQDFLLTPILLSPSTRSDHNNLIASCDDFAEHASIGRRMQNTEDTSQLLRLLLPPLPLSDPANLDATTVFRQYLMHQQLEFWSKQFPVRSDVNCIDNEDGDHHHIRHPKHCPGSTTDTGVDISGTPVSSVSTTVHPNGATALHQEYAACCLSYIADVCARLQAPGPCAIAWIKLRQCGMVPRENCVSTYMYVLSLQQQNVSFTATATQTNLVTAPSTSSVYLQQQAARLAQQQQISVPPQSDNHDYDLSVRIIEDMCLDVATFHDMLFEPNEKTITLRIKTLISKDDPIGAEQVLASLPCKESPPPVVNASHQIPTGTNDDISSSSVSTQLGSNSNKKRKFDSPITSEQDNKHVQTDSSSNITQQQQQQQRQRQQQTQNHKMDWKRLRTFLPILSYYCTDSTSANTICHKSTTASSQILPNDNELNFFNDKDNNDKKMASALRLLQQMRLSPGVHMDTETYAIVISTMARRGWFFSQQRQQSSTLTSTTLTTLSTTTELNNEPDSLVSTTTIKDGECSSTGSNIDLHSRLILEKGPKALDFIATALAEDLLEIDERSAKVIFDGFMQGHQSCKSTCNNDVKSLVYDTHGNYVPDACLYDTTDESVIGNDAKTTSPSSVRFLIGRVSVDQSTSICPATGATLRLFALNEQQREQVHSTLLQMAAQQHEEYGEKLLARRHGQATSKTTTTNHNNKNKKQSGAGKDQVTGVNQQVNASKDIKRRDSFNSSSSEIPSGTTTEVVHRTAASVTTAPPSHSQGVENQRNGQYAYSNLLAFSNWLRERSDLKFSENSSLNITHPIEAEHVKSINSSKPSTNSNTSNSDQRDCCYYTAIVDGPNVAYYGHGEVHYHQIQMVVETLERMGERPLVIMPQKYMNDKFWIALGYIQELSPTNKTIRDQLLQRDQLYVVPTQCLDDYYWMLASVVFPPSSPSSSSSHKSPTISNSGSDTALNPLSFESQELPQTLPKFPGLRPLLITNDQMRDHRLSLLLEPRAFRRWMSCHIVNYEINTVPGGNNDINIDHKEMERILVLKPADFFSREIQSNPVSSHHGSLLSSTSNSELPKSTITHDHNETKAIAWHIPVTEWPEPDRFCITVLQ